MPDLVRTRNDHSPIANNMHRELNDRNQPRVSGVEYNRLSILVVDKLHCAGVLGKM